MEGAISIITRPNTGRRETPKISSAATLSHAKRPSLLNAATPTERSRTISSKRSAVYEGVGEAPASARIRRLRENMRRNASIIL
jgi:hypothetical protein